MKKEEIRIVEATRIRHWSPDGYSSPSYTLTVREDGETLKCTDYDDVDHLIEVAKDNNIDVVDDESGDVLTEEEVREYYSE